MTEGSVYVCVSTQLYTCTQYMLYCIYVHTHIDIHAQHTNYVYPVHI